MADEGSDVENIIELYNQWKKEVLEELHEVLVRDIDPQRFFPHFRSKKLIDEDDQEEVMCEKTRRQKASYFLNLLSRKGGNGFDELCEALLKSAGQLHLLGKLLNAFEEKKQGAEELEHIRRLPPATSMLNNPVFPSPGQIGGPELPSGYFQSFMSEAPPPYSQ